ncbi:MAG: acetyltransferase [Bacteroidia bacterium]|nr:acetyltransferase [Bacteroidia bacterium]
MLDSKEILIFGYSGHAYVVIDVAISCGYIVKEYVDLVENKLNPFNLIYKGSESSINIADLSTYNFCFPALGSNEIRFKLVNYFSENNLNQTILIHPSSIISGKSKIGLSTFISSAVVVNPLVKIGVGCIINTGVIVEHECNIGDFTHLAPGVVLAGNVNIGSFSFLGANSVVKQGVKIGNNVVVGAGSVVLNDIPDNETWVGNPARKLR